MYQKKTIEVEGLGTVKYSETFWFLKEISVNGQKATKMAKNTFVLGENTFLLDGDFRYGLTVKINDQWHTITENAELHEKILMWIPAVYFTLSLFGFLPIPLLGGVLGILLYDIAEMALAAVRASSSGHKVWLMIGINVLTLAISIGLGYLFLFVLSVLLGILEGMAAM